MKKSRFYLSMAIVALSWMGCSQEEEVVNQMQMGGGKTINATIESTTRSTVTDAGVFSWATGDAISLHDGTNVDTYKYSGSGNGFTLPDETTETVTEPIVAYYPASGSHTKTAFNLPAFYYDANTEYVASTNAAMIATPPTEGSTYAFMHLGGVMRFNVKNVPADADGFQFTAEGMKITGSFEIENGDAKTIKTSESTDNDTNVSIWFKQPGEVCDMTFYVPMPTGTYGDYTVSLRINGTLISHTSEDVTNTINRKTLLLMPTFTYDATTGKLEKGTAKVGVIDLEDGDESANIEASADIVVTPGEDEATATLNYTPADDGSSALSISDGSGATTSGDSEGNVVVSTADGSTVASCDINTPSLTVELSAAENGTATYEEVTALTAQQTLIIGEGVTINKLIVKGGNVVLKGNVKSIESKVATTIKLENDIESAEIITISGPITLDGDGKTLTSTAGRAINVDTEGSVTIQNLTIKAGERAINIIDKAATVNVNKVTAKANNNAIMIATSAGAAKLTVEESDLTGLAVINVAGAGAQVEIKNTKITNVDPEGTDAAYGAITISGTAENSNVNVDTNSTITVADNSKKAYVFPGTAVIEGVDNVGYVYATIGDNGCETLAKAIEEAEAGQTITILRDITASEIITINKAITLDGNGKTLTSTAGRAINVETDGSVTIKNLKVEAKGERAFNVINKPAKLTLEGVTATAKNYAVMIATSAGETSAATLDIKNSELTGAATIQIAGAGTIATITDTQITSVDNSSAEGYAPITVFNTADNAKITVTGGSITLKGSNLDEGASAAYSDADGVSITFNNVTGENLTINNGACYIPYSNQTSYGFTSLAEALEWAKGGGTIVLAKNITISANTEIPANITIDGNNYSVSTDTGAGVAGKGKGVFLLTGGTIKNVNFTSPNTQYDIIVKAGGSVIEGCKFETASEVTDAAGTTTYGKRAIYTGSSVELTGNLTVTGCTFDDQVYAFNFLSGKNKMDVTFNSCTLGGWLSGTGASHTFTNCTFKESGDYANYIPYCPATFNGCTFDNGFTISVKHGSTYAFDTNCKYNKENETGIALTDPNSLLWDFSGSGTDNGSNETVTIGEESNKWTIEVGENNTIIWKSSSNEGGSDA